MLRPSPAAAPSQASMISCPARVSAKIPTAVPTPRPPPAGPAGPLAGPGGAGSPPGGCRRRPTPPPSATDPRARPAASPPDPAPSGSQPEVFSSGGALAERSPRRGGGPLLGLLLAAPLGAAVADAGHHHPGGECLGMVGAGVLDHVVRHAEAERGGQLLQAGLPVQRGAPPGRLGHQRVEQPVDHLAGDVQAVLEIDRAE